MPTYTPISIYNGTLGTANATLATVPTAKTYIIKEITLANKTAAAATATIKFDGVNIVPAKSVGANDALVVDLSSVITATKLIEGLAGTASAIDVRISGLEVV